MTGTTFTDPAETETWTEQHWSRHEWFYMWTKGLDPRRIAMVCRVPYRKVYDHIRGRIKQNPDLFGQRLMVHDRPALPRGGLAKRRPWDKRCADLAEFWCQHGRFPRSYVKGEASLYSFLQYQRDRYRAGTLPDERVSYLNKYVPGWLTPKKQDRDNALWELRADELRAFLSRHMRYPSYKAAKERHEAVLATWVTAQRRSLREGKLEPARRARLHEVTRMLAASLGT